MLKSTLALIALAACSTPTPEAPPDHGAARVATPDDFTPSEEDPQENQHFCCQSVDPNSNTGDGCVTIDVGQINACANVIYCSGDWTKVDGNVSCN